MSRWSVSCWLVCSLFAVVGCLERGAVSLPATSEPQKEVVSKAEESGSQPGLAILTESRARELATEFLNRELKDRKFLQISGDKVSFPAVEPTIWRSVIFDYQKRRIILRFGGSGGFEAMVSLGTDGSDPKVEHAEFAWN